MSHATHSKDSPKVIIILLVYNGRKWLEKCFKSIMDSHYSHFTVVAVDNNSLDDSCDYIEKNYPFVHIIRNEKNYATAKGSNIGIRYALKQNADYVLILNQDIKAEGNWLNDLVDIAEKNKEIGILTPIQLKYDEEGLDTSFKETLKGTTYFDDEQSNNLKEIYYTDFAIGATVLIRKEVFYKVGLLDPLYFMYSDDNDFCRRTIYHGFKIAVATKAKVRHHHSLIHMRGLHDPTTKKKKSTQDGVYRFKRNYLMLLLKNPNQSFFQNLKHAYVWTNWSKLFNEVEPKYFSMLRAFCFLLFYLPLIYTKFLLEKKQACYLDLK